MSRLEFLRVLCIAVFVSSCSAAIGPIADLTLVNAEVSPDGFTKAATLAASGTLHGPIIQGNKGDNFQINVTNQLVDSSMLRSASIHWHGISQSHSNDMDGVAFVNQCPIAPGHSFMYNFTVPEQSGTYWYHSHYGTQYCDGLRGPLVIYDPEDPYLSRYDVDDDSTVITLSDWYHEVSALVPPQSPPASTLVNGLGRYEGGLQSPLSVISVIPGKRYRMRLINMACQPNYVFSIDRHEFTIIEADGVLTEPLRVDSIQIAQGQRYSFILEANQPIDNYWVRSMPNTATGNTSFANGNHSAILRYTGALSKDPEDQKSQNVTSLDESNLHALNHAPVTGSPAEGGADVELVIDIAVNTTTLDFMINGVAYKPPSVPVLLQILSGAMNATDLLPRGSVYMLPRNKTIEITIPGGSSGSPHPFHLHGHKFDVVRSVQSNAYNFINPVQRDTVNTGFDGDMVTVRFRTDSPGPWMFHCHNNWHLNLGMAIIFVEDPGEVASSSPVTKDWESLCPIYNNLSSAEQG
ncbi:laccase [Serpula lacrymans var. lacrymans S7.3]|uniref:Laccase n=2 Tax=Serpula lacrymans var. lacrymans TaxID=341189 RepID=F8Q484_SERL3|nr:laccase [Serpula lacrymans var. lacrymans S7.9]EGN97077.1 laccase [Serpula lacrymans var. lacrymans S7.3]EGO22679.1 laccase [Serpula lacrymans var. lacrymans S7.9]